MSTDGLQELLQVEGLKTLQIHQCLLNFAGTTRARI